METQRNNDDGTITVTGANFQVIARPDGHVTVFSAIPFSVVTLSPGSNMVDVLCDGTGVKSKERQHARADEPSPRSYPDVKARGAR